MYALVGQQLQKIPHHSASVCMEQAKRRRFGKRRRLKSTQCVISKSMKSGREENVGWNSRYVCTIDCRYVYAYTWRILCEVQHSIHDVWGGALSLRGIAYDMALSCFLPLALCQKTPYSISSYIHMLTAHCWNVSTYPYPHIKCRQRVARLSWLQITFEREREAIKDLGEVSSSVL